MIPARVQSHRIACWLLSAVRVAAVPVTHEGAPPPPEAWVQTNPLKHLAPLPKVHHSWALPPEYLNNSDPSYIDGVVFDYVRISGTCPIPLVADGYVEVMTKSCVALCKATVAPRKQAGLPRAVITANYSPWSKIGNDPTVSGAAEKSELVGYQQLLLSLHKWVSPDTGIVGAVLLDQEVFSIVCPGHPSCDALTRKNDLIYNLTRSVFPNVRIEQYDRGAVASTDRWNHYCGDATTCSVSNAFDRPYHYTLQDQGSSFGVSLYQLPEIWHQRTIYRQTVSFAQSHHNNSGQTRSVTPWLSLGAGYRRYPNFTKPWLVDYAYTFDWDYDRVYSWQFGAEINIPWYGEEGREEMFAPWRHAEVVCLYPSVFDLRSRPAGPHNRSTVMMQHFVSYVRAANGLAGVEP